MCRKEGVVRHVEWGTAEHRGRALYRLSYSGDWGVVAKGACSGCGMLFSQCMGASASGGRQLRRVIMQVQQHGARITRNANRQLKGSRSATFSQCQQPAPCGLVHASRAHHPEADPDETEAAAQAPLPHRLPFAAFYGVASPMILRSRALRSHFQCGGQYKPLNAR